MKHPKTILLVLAETAFVLLLILCQMKTCLASNATHYPCNNVYHSSNIDFMVQGSYKEFFPLMLQLGLDTVFREDQKNIIKNASQIFINRALENRIIDCAYRNSSKNLPTSRDAFINELYSAISPNYISGTTVPAFAFIASFNNDPNIVGIGYVDLFYDCNNPLPGYKNKHYLHIAINSDKLGNSSNYFFAKNEAYWAGIIAHEFLHNLGYEHKGGYTGSFINEYRKCIQYDGASLQMIDGNICDFNFDKEVYRDDL
ncbi:MAG: hypothetical protein HQK53_14720 [Oligoflexia bacterium]|nr:hypothetical protein [Oligoflexia bacterium]